MKSKKGVFIIAEVGSVHDGSFGNAKKLIELVARVGADAVKFQTHIAETETLIDAPEPSFFKGEPRWDYFKRTSFNRNQWLELKKHARQHGLEFISSPFSIEAAKLLRQIGVSRYKIPSGEVTNLPLLRYLAKTGKPILLSTGMSNWKEINEAVKVITTDSKKLTILQCATAYPTDYKMIGLNVIQQLKRRYKLPVGLSDHSMTNYSAFAAVVQGASVIEKHITFSRSMYGSDAKNSLEPNEFEDLIIGIRAIEVMMNSPVDKNDISQFLVHKKVFEKSIVSTKDIPAGKKITSKLVALKKPGTGLSAKELKNVIGMKAKSLIKANSLIKATDLKK